jgi:hypothetical protein
MWALQVITSFPPGAITVVTIHQASYEILTVPTFNASFVSTDNFINRWLWSSIFWES